MKLLDLIFKEFFAIVKYLEKNFAIENGRIIINSKIFYTMLDKNLYIKRKEKLDFYRDFNLIICNSNSYAAVIYDKETKKLCRKVILNYTLYRTLKKLSETEISI